MTRSGVDPQRSAASRWSAAAEHAFLALVVYVPLFVSGRGLLDADTKQYLYLDPAGLVRRAPILWDPHVAGGTVTHQNIGYLWPMGPYYWAASALGLPDWVAQRIWMGSIQFVAAAGALALFRMLWPAHWGQVAAALVYGLSPFVLGHITGQSGLLLPFAALPWMAIAARRSAVAGGWRWPAVFALIVTTCGSLNGSSVFFIVVGACLWFPYATWVERMVTWRGALAALARTTVLTALCQLWWLVAYAVGGKYGLPILRFTETVTTTSETTSAAEVLRGLGYWFFYGADVDRAWLDGIAPPYLHAAGLVLVTFAVPVLGLALGALTNVRERGYFVLLAVLGLLTATIAFPFPDRSLAGSAFLAASRRSDFVLSLRNTQRATPLLVLGLAGLAACGLHALRARHGRVATAVTVVLALGAIAAFPMSWRTGLVADRFHRPDAIPAAWTEAATALDRGSGRVLEIPGIDFASYRWGNTLDPIGAGLLDRPVLWRELIPMGGAPGTSLLSALDRSMQEGWFEAQALVPVARMLGTTDILVRNDLEYERYLTVRPSVLWPQLTSAAAGLGAPASYGAPYVNAADSRRPLLDETALGTTARSSVPLPQVATFSVPGSTDAIVRAAPAGYATVLDGDGAGAVAAAAAGLLDLEHGPVLLAADLTKPDAAPFAATGPGVRYVLTDTDRKQAQRYYALRGNLGATEPADASVVTSDVFDGRVAIVEGQLPSSQSVAVIDGARAVSATAYGNPFTLVSEDRPVNAFDGDARTAWRVDTNSYTAPTVEVPHTVSIDLGRDVTADHLVVVQPQGRPGTRAVRTATVVLDGTRRFPVDIDPALAFDPAGVRVALDGRPFHHVAVEIGDLDGTPGPAGFAEITIPGVTVHEVIALPTDLRGALIDASSGTDREPPLATVLTRLRANPREPVRQDPELAMRRLVELPVPTRLTLSGTARLNPGAADTVLDALLDVGASAGLFTASEHLAGDLASRASALVDGRLDTAWTTPFVGVVGQRWTARLAAPVTLSTLELDVVDDAQHSVPTSLTLIVDGVSTSLALPAAAATGAAGATRHVSVPLPRPVRGSVVELRIEAIDERSTTDWYSAGPSVLPAALAELRLPGVVVASSATVATACRDDLLTIDGTPVALRVLGDVETDGRGALRIEACDPAGVQLGAGRHEIVTAAGLDTGLDLDRLVLQTASFDATPRPAASPSVTIEHVSSTAVDATIASDGSPFWLRLDQSLNAGWHATARIGSATVDLGEPRPLDLFANGWLVQPSGAGQVVVELRWTPQKAVDLALGASAVGVVLCLGLVVLGGRRRRPVVAAAAPSRRERADAPRGPWRDATVIVGAGTLGLVFGDLWVAAGVALLAAAVLHRRTAAVARFAPAALAALAGAGVTLAAYAHRNDGPRLEERFPLAHRSVLVAILALGVTALAEHRPRDSWRRGGGPNRGASSPESDPPEPPETVA